MALQFLCVINNPAAARKKKPAAALRFAYFMESNADLWRKGQSVACKVLSFDRDLSLKWAITSDQIKQHEGG
jgi:hypothetical protein